MSSISVIIPTKNEEKNIVRCLTSIRNQVYNSIQENSGPKSGDELNADMSSSGRHKGKIEIIVVDNHSQDKTRRLAKPFSSKIIISGGERSAQRNHGARLAKGKYLIFLDADMEISQDVVSEIAKLLRGDKSIVSIPEIGQGKSFWEKVLSLERSCYFDEKDIHAARGFPKKLFRRAGGYDTKIFAGEDWDLTLRCKALGAKLLTTKSTINHYEKAKSLSDLIKKDYYYIGNIHLFAQKHPRQFAKYASFRYRGWLLLKNYKNLIRHPILTLALIFYKVFIHTWSRPHWYKVHD